VSDIAPTSAVRHVTFALPFTLREIRLTTTPTSTQRLGEHENALFAKWVSARRDKLKRATITDHSAGPSKSKRATK